jgi:hypothetical protein
VRRAEVSFGLCGRVDLRQNWRKKKHQKVRWTLGRGRDQEGRALPRRDGRIEENTAAAVADSEDRFRQPGNAIGSGARGELARRERGLNRHRGEPN